MDYIEIIYKLFLGSILGALIGAERSFFKKQAGLRTFALVGLGATLFSLMATKFALDSASRILANIVLGIGFLGAGIIFYHEEKIVGATTAASLWTTAAIGAAVGQGFYLEAFTTTILVILILSIFPLIEERIRTHE